MAITGSPFHFEHEAPTVQDLRECAEKLGGLRIKSTRRYRGADFEFEFLSGEVSASRLSDGIFLSMNTGEAPVLFDLLRKSLEDLGGKMPGDRDPLVIELPLTREYVAKTTKEYQREIRKAAGRVWMFLFACLIIGVGIIGLIVWGIWLLVFAD